MSIVNHPLRGMFLTFIEFLNVMMTSSSGITMLSEISVGIKTDCWNVFMNYIRVASSLAKNS